MQMFTIVNKEMFTFVNDIEVTFVNLNITSGEH